MNHGADEEIAAQLYGVRLSRFFADDRDSARERLQDRPSAFNGRVDTSNHGPQPAFLRHVWPAKDWSSDKVNAALCVLHCKPLAESHADGAAGNVECSRRKRVEQCVRAE